MGTTFVETYLGCDIFFYTPPTVAYDQYGTPCLTTNYVTLTAVKKRICLSQNGTWDGSTCSFEPEVPDGNGATPLKGLVILLIIYSILTGMV